MGSSDHEVCASCGVLQKQGSGSCGVCGHDRRIRTPAPRFGAYWVGVVVRARCESCENGTCVDEPGQEVVDCSACGSSTPIGREAWRAVVRFAHDVGDLAGPEPEGRPTRADVTIGARNPYRSLGLRGVAVRRALPAVREEGRIDVVVRPGSPFCSSCGSPHIWKPGARSSATLRCAGCEEQRAAGVPTAVDHLAVKAVHLPRRAPIEVEAEQAAALKCPVCGASLPPEDAGGLTRCDYCETKSLVPPDLTSRLAAIAPRWWLLFKGCSPLRERIILGGEQDTVGQIVE